MASDLEILDTSNPFEWLAFWADEKPLQCALLSPVVTMNFEELKSSVEHLSDRLSAFEISGGSRVVLALPAGFDWIATLALFKLGATPSYIELSSLVSGTSDDFDFGVSFEEPSLRSPSGLKLISLGPRDFEARSQVHSSSEVANYSDDIAICSLRNSSNRLMEVSFGTALKRLSTLPELYQEPRRELSLFSLGVYWGFIHSLKCLATGAPFLTLGYEPVNESDQFLINQINPRIVEGSAFSISKFLLYLEEQGLDCNKLEAVRYINSTLSADFFDYVKFQHGVHVFCRYGSLEVGVLFNNQIRAKSELSDLGDLVPSGKVRIVKDSGLPELPGDFGKAFAVTDYTVEHQSAAHELTHDQLNGYYLLDNKISRLNDRFWLGDAVSLRLSVGGDFVSAELLEGFAVSQSLVRDVACFEGFGPNGEPVLAMAVAGKRGFDLQSFADDIRTEFPGIHPRFFIELRGIPRYSSGAPHGKELSRLFSENFLNKNGD